LIFPYSRGKCYPHKKYFACFLVSNGSFKARNDIFHKISLYKEVKSGGPHLNNINTVIPRDQTNAFLSQCKFVIAYENTFGYPGYITEKVFQAYFAGSIPIYRAHPSASEDINHEAVIYNQDFQSDEEMIEYIKELDQDETKYCNKWHNKIITNPERNYEFMKSQIRQKLENTVRAKFKRDP
jgi:hypothetical protein